MLLKFAFGVCLCAGIGESSRSGYGSCCATPQAPAFEEIHLLPTGCRQLLCSRLNLFGVTITEYLGLDNLYRTEIYFLQFGGWEVQGRGANIWQELTFCAIPWQKVEGQKNIIMYLHGGGGGGSKEREIKLAPPTLSLSKA